MQRFQILRKREIWQRTLIWDSRIVSKQGNVTWLRMFSSLPDHEVVGLPALSPTMETGTIAKWIKQEGDLISAGDVICQVETDKAVVDYEAQDDAYLAKILKPEGSADISVGEPIFVTVESEDNIGAFADFKVDSSTETVLPEPPSPEPEAPKSTPPPPSPSKSEDASKSSSSSSPGRVIASPLAKKIARESGALLSAINGTGPGGRILKADVEAALAQSAETQSQEVSAPKESTSKSSESVSSGDYVDYPISKEAQELAKQLTQQKLDVPHYHLSVELTMDSLLAARAKLNAGRPEDSLLSVNDFIIRAASIALTKMPSLNASWQGTFIRQYNDVNINLAVSPAKGGGVVAPLISKVNRKGLDDINAQVQKIMSKADDGFSNEDLASGIITVSNVGMYDVKSLSGIVSQNQSAFLAVGTIQKKVVPDEDPSTEAIYKYAHMMTVTLACDHRVIDGATGAQWLQVFKELVEDPLKMIL